MKVVKPLLLFIRNKYLVAITCFIVWMLFFDPKDWSLISSRIGKLQDLEKSETHLEQKIKETRTELNMLKNNAQTIEKYAREKYRMKKDNEDLFIVNTP